MRKVVVFGSRGMLGHAVIKYFISLGDRVVAFSRHEFDIAKNHHSSLERFCVEADVVINCTGLIKPTIGGKSIEEVLLVNAVFPRNLALLCERTATQFFHITTDCVYSGSKGKYTENDLIDATDAYGLSKSAGEYPGCMVLRTSIIGEELGLSRSLLEWARANAGKKVSGYTNHDWNGVTTVYLAEIIDRIFTEGLFQKGIYHIHSPEKVTKFELLRLISDTYGLRLEIAPAEAPDRIDRTLASIHPLTKLVTVKPIRQQIAEMKGFFLKHNEPRE